MPRFSVIIPTYNRLELLKEALASVWAQTYSDHEVIVVDDGSTDGTWEYLQSLGDRVKAYKQQNSGPGAARNLGASHACGECLAFLDSDDLLLQWSLQTYAQLIEDYEAPTFIAGKPFQFSSEKSLAGVTYTHPECKTYPDYFSSSDAWRWWGVSSFVIRREVFHGVGGFFADKINGEDADLAIRLGTARGFLQVLAPCTFAYRVHGSGLMGDMDKTLKGAWNMVQNEQVGNYPGGRERSRQRREIITRHVRPVVLSCINHGLKREAWKLYMSIFAWHVALHRWKFLAGFWLKMFTVRA